MAQVRVLAPLNVGTLIDLPDADAWLAHERGLVSFAAEEEGLAAAQLAGELYQAPSPPPATQPA